MNLVVILMAIKHLAANDIVVLMILSECCAAAIVLHQQEGHHVSVRSCQVHPEVAVGVNEEVYRNYLNAFYPNAR